MSARTLFLLRGAWVGLLALGITSLLLSLPAQFTFLESPCYADCGQIQQLAPEQVQELQRLGLSMRAYATFSVALILLSPLVFVTVAGIIFSRKLDDWMALYCSFMLLAWGFGGQANGFSAPDPFFKQVVLLFQVLGNVGIVLFFLLFPDGRFVPRWIRWLAPFLVAREVLNVYFQDDWLNYSFLVSVALVLLVLVYRYRHVSNATQRQQTKWVVFGATIGVSGYASLILSLFLFAPPDKPLSILVMLPLTTALELFLLLVPISIGMAIVRSHLWDIDILIRRTLIYGALTIALALVYFGSVAVLENLLSAVIGEHSEIVIVISTLAIGALFAPLRHRIQQVVDKRFYRRKYDAQQVLARFAATAREEVELEKLTRELVTVVNETMQPASISLWLKKESKELRASQ